MSARAQPIRIMRRIAAWFLVGTVAVLLGGLLYLRAWPPMLLVMTSSMEPTIETGAVVVMKQLDRTPQLGDIVAIEVPAEVREEFGYPDRVLHRVVEITGDGLVRTQGDHLDEPDPFAVPLRQVNQQVIAAVPGAGQAIAFLTSPYGLLWLAAGLFLFLVMPFIDSQRQLRLAVLEYGYHLRSHTATVQNMAAASKELAATTEQLREVLATPQVGSGWPPAQRSADLNTAVKPNRRPTSQEVIDKGPPSPPPPSSEPKRGRTGRHRRPRGTWRQS